MLVVRSCIIVRADGIESVVVDSVASILVIVAAEKR